MDRLEELVRDTLLAHEDDAPPAAPLLAAVQRRTRRRGPGRWRIRTMTAAAAAVLVAGTAVAVVAIRPGTAVLHPARKPVVTVPPAAAQTDLVHAYDMLHRLGLRVTLTKETYVASQSLPAFLTLSPGPGSRVPKGSTIKITPHGGPVASAALQKSNPHYRVPSFTGHTLSDAVRWAGDHAMFWAIPNLPALHSSAAPQLFDAYRVVDQSPAPGDVISQGILHGHTFKPTPLMLTVVVQQTR